MIQPDDMRIVMAYYWKADFQIHLHTNGDKAMDLVIENVINLQKVYPRVDHKTTIEHAGFFTEKQADQLAELGCLGQKLALFSSSQNQDFGFFIISSLTCLCEKWPLKQSLSTTSNMDHQLLRQKLVKKSQ